MTKQIDVLIGKSLSGKSFVMRQILSADQVKSKIHKMITCTTRPMRDEDQADLTYHFWSNRDYLDMLDKSPERIIAARSYTVQQNQQQTEWHYFIDRNDLLALAKNDAADRILLIIDWQGYLDLTAVIANDYLLHQQFQLYGYYLNTNLKTRLARMVNSPRSSEDPHEILRRVYYDEFIDFKSLDQLAQTSPQQLKMQYHTAIYDSTDDLLTAYFKSL